jgi:hypothetical protein
MGKNLAIGYAPTEHKSGRTGDIGRESRLVLDSTKLTCLSCLAWSANHMVAYRATQVRGVHELLANGALDGLSRCGCGKWGFCESLNII